ncbi:hypothetical protein ACA910_008480 [Epithemia clementina (nom. ined.)]
MPTSAAAAYYQTFHRLIFITGLTLLSVHQSIWFQYHQQQHGETPIVVVDQHNANTTILPRNPSTASSSFPQQQQKAPQEPELRHPTTISPATTTTTRESTSSTMICSRSGGGDILLGGGGSYSSPTSSSSSHPLTLWKRHAWVLQQASSSRATTKSADKDDDHDDDNDNDQLPSLFRFVTPLLPASVRAVPRQSWSGWQWSMQRVWMKLQARQAYLMKWWWSSRIRRTMEDPQQQQEEVINPNDSGSFTSFLPPPPPPPLQIVVLGGSVALGILCPTSSSNTRRSSKSKKQQTEVECAWPSKLERQWNQLFWRKLLWHGDDDDDRRRRGGSTNHTTRFATFWSNKEDPPPPPPLVQVHVAARGGKDSSWSTKLWDLNGLPPNVQQHADIVINAHATNDMHDTVRALAKQENKTHFDKVLELRQDFIRTVVGGGQQHVLDQQERPSQSSAAACSPNQPLPPPPPLLYFLDDYLGNTPTKLYDLSVVSQATQLLINHYGVGAISYPDAVRDFKYANTHETFLTESWYDPEPATEDEKATTTTTTIPAESNMTSTTRRRGTIMKRGIHPGETMHQLTAWIVLYNLLHMGAEYCAVVESQQEQQEQGQLLRRSNNTMHRSTIEALQVPQQVLPPPLTKNLDLADISQQWWSSSRSSPESSSSSSSASLSSSSLSQEGGCPDHRTAVSAAADAATAATSSLSGSRPLRCPVSWLASVPVPAEPLVAYPFRPAHAKQRIQYAQQFWEPYVTDWGGWQLQKSKQQGLAWMPPSAVDSNNNKNDNNNHTGVLVLEFTNLMQPIQFINLLSYQINATQYPGRKGWTSARVQVLVDSSSAAAPRPLSSSSSSSADDEWKRLGQVRISGAWSGTVNDTGASQATTSDHPNHHENNTSPAILSSSSSSSSNLFVSHQQREPQQLNQVWTGFTLKDPILTGQTLRLRLRLERGSQFQLRGLHICSSSSSSHPTSHE